MSTINGKIFPNTSFPNEIQTLPEFKDLSAEYQDTYVKYIKYLLEGNAIKAQEMQEQIDPDSLITANSLNTLADTIGAIQEVYSTTTVFTDILTQMQAEWEAKEKTLKYIGLWGTDVKIGGIWTSGTPYGAGTVVRGSNNLLYIAKSQNAGKDPVVSTDYWERAFVRGNIVRDKFNSTCTNPAGLEIADGTELLYMATDDISTTTQPIKNTAWKLLSVVGAKGDNATGFTWSDSWQTSTNYAVGNLVVYNNVAYSCLIANSGKNPETNPLYWKKEFFIESGSIPVQATEPEFVPENGLWFKTNA